MRKRIVIIIVLLAAAGAAVYAIRASGRKPDNRIVVSGNIELTEVNIAFKTAGRLIERTVDEGDKVTKGQIIARLDRDHAKPRACNRPNRNWRRRARRSNGRRLRWLPTSKPSAATWPRPKRASPS
jgi:multidrug resistance efflux pump